MKWLSRDMITGWHLGLLVGMVLCMWAVFYRLSCAGPGDTITTEEIEREIGLPCGPRGANVRCRDGEPLPVPDWSHGKDGNPVWQFGPLFWGSIDDWLFERCFRESLDAADLFGEMCDCMCRGGAQPIETLGDRQCECGPFTVTSVPPANSFIYPCIQRDGGSECAP